MARPKTITDTVVLEAAFSVITRLGPSEFTLSDVAKAAGLAPATLVQRFGSKRGLLLAMTRIAAEGSDQCFIGVRTKHKSPIKALFASFDEMACMAATPEALANTLAFLQMNLTDPEFRQWSLMNSRAMLAGFRALLDDAIRAGELERCDTEGLARLIQAATHGSLVSWAFHQEGDAAAWMRRDMEVLLKPYRKNRRPKRRPSE